MNRVQCIPSITHQHLQIHCQLQHTLFPFQRLSAGYLQPHSYNFGNFLRRKAAGAITFFYALQRQFRLYIPFLGIARPQPQFPHSCVLSDLYIPRIILHTVFPPAEQADPSWEYIIRPQTHECGNWDWGFDIPFLGIFVSNVRHFVFAVWVAQWSQAIVRLVLTV